MLPLAAINKFSDKLKMIQCSNKLASAYVTGSSSSNITYLEKQGRSQEFIFFSLLGGANHTNLYKKIIKIQMFNINL